MQSSGIYSAAGKVLLEALSPDSASRSVDFQQDSANWRSRGLAVYRDYLSCGNSPPLRVLDRLLASLRLPFSLEAEQSNIQQDPPRLVRALQPNCSVPDWFGCPVVLLIVDVSFVFACKLDSPGLAITLEPHSTSCLNNQKWSQQDCRQRIGGCSLHE